MTSSAKKVAEKFQQLAKLDLIDDRREYSAEDLNEAYSDLHLTTGAKT